jgi:hypothetical protein
MLKKYRDPKRALAVARRGLAVPAPGSEYVESLEALEWLQRVEDAFGAHYGSGAASGG